MLHKVNSIRIFRYVTDRCLSIYDSITITFTVSEMYYCCTLRRLFSIYKSSISVLHGIFHESVMETEWRLTRSEILIWRKWSQDLRRKISLIISPLLLYFRSFTNILLLFIFAKSHVIGGNTYYRDETKEEKDTKSNTSVRRDYSTKTQSRKKQAVTRTLP